MNRIKMILTVTVTQHRYLPDIYLTYKIFIYIKSLKESLYVSQYVSTTLIVFIQQFKQIIRSQSQFDSQIFGLEHIGILL